MDRGKKDDLPKMQVDFIDAICLPVYKVGVNNVRRHITVAMSTPLGIC